MADPKDSGNPVAPQTDTTPPQAPDLGQASVPGDATAPSIGGPTKGPALPTGSQINADPNAAPGSVEPHLGMLGSIFQDLAGGQKTTWRQTDTGPVAVKENLKPGDMARSIVAAALTGLASGYKTHGGPGGNKGQAFAAGFEGEQARRDKEANEQKQQAQTQFQNKNVADEMTLRKAANARDQQHSIELSQQHAMHMHQAEQDLSQGKTDFAERTVNFENQQADRMNLLVQLGAKPLSYPDGKPVEEFNSPAEAAEWANQHPTLGIDPGKYMNVFEVDPVTNRYVIMQKPKGWDDPTWLGVKVDPKTNQPEKDKNGNMIPDGSFKDSSGKVVAPASQMSPKQMYDSQTRLLDLQSKILSREEALERLKTAKTARIKDQQQSQADEQFNRANGNPDAIDEKTGNFIVTPSSRTILQQRFIKEAAMEATALNAIQKEMDRVGVPSAGASETEKQEYAEMNQQAVDARNNLHQLQVHMGLLSRTPNIADVTASNLRTQYTKPDGTFDEESALKAADKITAPAAVKAQMRARLSSEPPPRPADQINKVAKQIAALPPDQQEATIAKQPLNKADMAVLRTQVKAGAQSPAQVKDALSDVAPDSTLFINKQTGGRQIIPTSAAQDFAAANANYTAVGVGTQQSTPDNSAAR